AWKRTAEPRDSRVSMDGADPDARGLEERFRQRSARNTRRYLSGAMVHSKAERGDHLARDAGEAGGGLLQGRHLGIRFRPPAAWCREPGRPEGEGRHDPSRKMRMEGDVICLMRPRPER